MEIKSTLQRKLSLLIKNDLIKESSLVLVIKFFGLITAYGWLIVVSKYYGARGIGLFSFFFNTLNLVGVFCTLGTHISLLKYFGIYKNEESVFKINVFYKRSISLVFVISLFVSLILYVGKSFISINIFNNRDYIYVIEFVSFSLTFYAIYLVSIEQYRVNEKLMTSEMARSFLRQALSILLLLGIYHFGSSSITDPLLASFISISLISVALILFQFNVLIKNYKSVKLGFQNIIGESFSVSLSSILSILLAYIPVLFIAKYCTAQDLGIYNVSLRIALIMNFILTTLNKLVASKLSYYYFNNNKEELEKTLRFTVTTSFIISFPILLLNVLIPEKLLSIFGTEFISGSLVLIFLSISQIINILSGSIGTLFNMTGLHNYLVLIISVTLVVDISLSYLLTPSFGIEGAAIASMITVILWNLTSVILMYKKRKIQTFYIPFISKKLDLK